MADSKDDGDRISWRLMLGWSIGTVGPITLLYVVNYAFMFYMTDLLGLSAALAGFMIFAVRIYDAFVDPLVGTWSDRTRTRLGRRRPWMLAGGIISAAGCVMLFNAPASVQGSDNSLLIWWSLAGLVIYFTGYSMFNVPYMAMPAEMSENFHQRTRLMGARVFFVAISALLGTALMPMLLEALGRSLPGYGQTAVIMSAVSLLAMLVAVVSTSNARATVHVPSNVGPLAQLKLTLGNRPFMVLIGCKLMLLLAMSSVTTTLYYFVVHVLKLNFNSVAQIGLAQTVGMLVSLPLWIHLARRFEKQHVFMISSILCALALLSWMTAEAHEPLWALLLRPLCFGFFSGGSLLMGQSLLPDTMEYDYRRTGLRREGIFAGMYSLVEKLGYAFGPLLIGFLLSSFGYVETKAGAAVVEQTAKAQSALYIGVSIIPAVATLVCVVLLRYYNLTEAGLKAMTPPAVVPTHGDEPRQSAVAHT